MITIEFDNFRLNFKRYFNIVRKHSEPVKVVTDIGNFIMIKEEEYNNIKENLFIMSNHAMVNRLRESIKQLGKGQTVSFDIDALN